MAIPPDYSDFEAEFPFLVDPAPTTAKQTWITNQLSKEYLGLSADYWGSDRSSAALLRVAHRYNLRANRVKGAAGAITAKSTDDWSISFASPSTQDSDSYWNQSEYGQEYLELRNRKIGGVSRVST